MRNRINAFTHLRSNEPRATTIGGKPRHAGRPFIQNKPNFRKAQINVTSVSTEDYENESASRVAQNKPNQTQFQRKKMLLLTTQEIAREKFLKNAKWY